MKLFGNRSGQHTAQRTDKTPYRPTRTEEPRSWERAQEPPQREMFELKPTAEAPRTRSAPVAPPEPKPDVQFTFVEPEGPISVSQIDSEAELEAETPPPRKKRRFGKGLLVYILVFLVLSVAALGVFWYWLDNYELGRPQRTMENYLSAADSAYWENFLRTSGVEQGLLDSLDLEDTSYFKKVDLYTDETPVFGIRFGDREMLLTSLRPGRALPFGQTTWDVDKVELVRSGLVVYAPPGAQLLVDGQPVAEDCLTQPNAQKLSLNPLEQSRTDIPGLDRYEIDYIYSDERLRVLDAAGNELPLSQRRGKRYYYAPLSRTYTVEAPLDATVTANGVVLSEANATVSTAPMADFEGLETWIDPLPVVTRYELENLLMEPELMAYNADGALSVLQDGDHYLVSLSADETFTEEVRQRVLDAFDAYIAFSGNRNANLNANYARYNSFLVPDSVAADRASKALDSLLWVKGRDTALESQQLTSVLRYGEDCFTARIDYAMQTDTEVQDNSILMIFVRYNDGWSIVNILNKTTAV